MSKRTLHCHECGEDETGNSPTFSRSSVLLRHWLSTHAALSNQDYLICDDCGVQRLQRHHLLRHQRRIHHRRNVTAININTLQSTQHLINLQLAYRHNWQSREEPEAEFACDDCGSGDEFANRWKNNLQRHMLMVHLRGREQCEMCGRTFDVGGLRRHVKIVHQGVQKTCDDCSKRLPMGSAGKLHQHWLVAHRGLRMHCTVCRLDFATQGGRDKHFRRLHLYEMHVKQEATTERDSGLVDAESLEEVPKQESKNILQ